jgi:hypothetical protein
VTLHRCAECSKPVSDRAVACPNCGAPAPAASAPGSQRPQRKTHPVAWAALLALVGYLAYESYQANLPQLPVAVRFRPALIGSGLVLMFENTSAQEITFIARLNRPDTNNTRSMELHARPYQTVSVGSGEGWTGEHGDQITLKNNRFQTWTGSIP